LNQQDDLHHLTIYTAQHSPLLTEDLLVYVKQALKNLPARFPGLKILDQAVHPDRVEMTLDFQRLDEDVLRVVQSFKSEVKNLAKNKKFPGDSLWQWNYEDQ